MGTIDLRELDGDHIVIHYGGSLTSVDAYTFANSLVAFSDTARAVYSQGGANGGLTIRVEALGRGSFRAVIKKSTKGLGGFFQRGAETMLWAAVGWLIFDRLLSQDPNVVVQVSDDMVVVQRGDDRIIVPRKVYDSTAQLKCNPEVQKNLKRTFEIVERDEAIENFGVTKDVRDKEPLVQVNRAEFLKMTRSDPVALDAPNARTRERTEDAILIILKAWVNAAGDRKWSFEWNGFPISAPIHDYEFLRDLEDRRYLIGSGDALRVLLKYIQIFDETLGIFVNDQGSFEVVKVYEPIPRPSQTSF